MLHAALNSGDERCDSRLRGKSPWPPHDGGQGLPLSGIVHDDTQENSGPCPDRRRPTQELAPIAEIGAAFGMGGLLVAAAGLWLFTKGGKWM